LQQGLESSALFVVRDELEAEKWHWTFLFFSARKTSPYFPRRTSTFSLIAPNPISWENKRVTAFCKIASGEAPFIVAPVDALLQFCPGPEKIQSMSRTIFAGEELPIDSLCGFLTAAGYARCEKSGRAGQFSRRGGLLDIFSPNLERRPAGFFRRRNRFDFLFDLLTQRRDRRKSSRAFPSFRRKKWCFPPRTKRAFVLFDGMREARGTKRGEKIPSP
jgi:transcription-repair coupling factor (superfamily II helicase)